MPAASNDPVTTYATAVVEGRVVAARLVRAACARHLHDLAHAADKGLVWYPDRAQEVIDFYAEILILPEETETEADTLDAPVSTGSTPFVLQPWQKFIVGSLMGWYAFRINSRGKRRETRRFRVAYLEVAKGSGKTPLAAGLLLYLLIADGEKGAQMFCAAVTKDQARLAFNDCIAMVKASPYLRDLIDQTQNNLAFLEMASFIRLISAEKRGLDGKRVHAAILDEEHEHATATVYLKMRAGTKGRANALILIPTNSGFDEETICGKHHDYSRQVLDGILENDSWFAFVCHLDPCPACLAAGKLQPSDDCPDCDDWRVEGPHWLKANPNLGVSITWNYLREQVREATDIPSEQNMVRRLNFCQWTQQATIWLPIEKWVACRGVLTLEAMKGRECYVGIDLSDKLDLTAVVLIFPRPLRNPLPERQEPEPVPAPPPGALALAPPPPPAPIDRAIDVIPLFWMPQRSIQARTKEDNVPYITWAKEGFLTTTPGDLVDHDAVVDRVIALTSHIQIKGIGVDQASASAVVTRLQRHFGDDLVVEVPQGFRALSEPCKTFEALVVSKNVCEDGNPVMKWCISNLGKEENHWREIRPVKLSARKRIDGAVACIDAVHVMQRIAVARPPEYQMLFLGGR
jgi:phage terminase large subunit-like protein